VSSRRDPRRDHYRGRVRSLRSVVELVLTLVAVVFFVIVIQAFAVKPYRIPSASMEPTLAVGDRVLVDRFSERILGHSPGVGDVVVFHPPAGADAQTCGDPKQGLNTSTPCDQGTPAKSSQTFIKRVVGVGGDRISIHNGHVIRNGKPEKDSYINACTGGMGCDFPTTITVPKGSFYMMGDNRGNSDDSRFWGPVPRKWVIGEARVTYWPPKRIGTI
jgi:signal peptidase I